MGLQLFFAEKARLPLAGRSTATPVRVICGQPVRKLPRSVSLPTEPCLPKAAADLLCAGHDFCPEEIPRVFKPGELLCFQFGREPCRLPAFSTQSSSLLPVSGHRPLSRPKFLPGQTPPLCRSCVHRHGCVRGRRRWDSSSPQRVDREVLIPPGQCPQDGRQKPGLAKSVPSRA